MWHYVSMIIASQLIIMLENIPSDSQSLLQFFCLKEAAEVDLFYPCILPLVPTLGWVENDDVVAAL
jgi:hypothetical protein